MSKNSMAYTDATELAGLIKTRQVSPVEVVDTFLRRIEALNPTLNAFLTVTAEEAIQAAREAEQALGKDGNLPPLHGVPVAIKDLEETRGVRTTYGSLVYEDFVPDEDSIIVERLCRAGAIILGKTNTPEFGQSNTTENRLGEDCCNPWDTTRTSGGSSGGSAAALAAGLCPLAVGTDGGGSIRVPAAYCGVFGMKATHGRVPAGDDGWALFSDAGPMSRTVRDAALMLKVVAGRDPRDSLSIREAPPDFLSALDGEVNGLRVGWSPDLGFAAVDQEVLSITRAAVGLLEEMGCRVEEATPDCGEPFEIFATIVLADTYADKGHLLDDHAGKLMRYVKSTLEHGQKITGAQYAQALRRLWRFRASMQDFFDRYDLLVTPATAVPAFPLRQRPTLIADREVAKLWGAAPFTATFNLTGNPAASVPCGFSSDGLPIGLQVVGRWGEDLTVLRVSAALEQAGPWAGSVPAIADC